MKKVIFVCLLSLSMCLSQSSPQKDAPPVAAGVTQDAANSTAPKTLPAGSETLLPANTTTPETKSNYTNATATDPKTTNATVPSNSTIVPPSNDTANKTSESAPAKDKNTDTKPNKDVPKPASDKVDPPKNETAPVVPANKATNETVPDTKDKKNETSTPKPEDVSPIVPAQAKARAFDGPSFIGGMILTLGLLAIGFMGFKYYKNQTERNYHTL